MKKKQLTKMVKVVVSNIKVDERYYYFNYTATIDGKVKKGRYESDYDNGESPSQWKRTLESGYAAEQAIREVID